jgi:hypothetical protein
MSNFFLSLKKIGKVLLSLSVALAPFQEGSCLWAESAQGEMVLFEPNSQSLSRSEPASLKKDPPLLESSPQEKERILTEMARFLEDPEILTIFWQRLTEVARKKEVQEHVGKKLKGFRLEGDKGGKTHGVSSKEKRTLQQILQQREILMKQKDFVTLEAMEEALKKYGTLEELQKIADMWEAPPAETAFGRFHQRMGKLYKTWKPLVGIYLLKKVDYAVLGASMGLFEKRHYIRYLSFGCTQEAGMKLDQDIDSNKLSMSRSEYLRKSILLSVIDSSLDLVLESFLSDMVDGVFLGIEKVTGLKLTQQEEDTLFGKYLSNCFLYGLIKQYFSKVNLVKKHFLLDKDSKIYSFTWGDIWRDISIHVGLKLIFRGAQWLVGRNNDKEEEALS